jgi:hypothetical protein
MRLVCFALLLWLVGCVSPAVKGSLPVTNQITIDLNFVPAEMGLKAVNHGFVAIDQSNDYYQIVLQGCAVTPDNPQTQVNEYEQSFDTISPAAIFNASGPCTNAPPPNSRRASATFPMTKTSVTFNNLQPNTHYFVAMRVFQKPATDRQNLTAINRTLNGTATTGQWLGPNYQRPVGIRYIEVAANGFIRVRDMDNTDYNSLPFTIPVVDTSGATLDGKVGVSLVLPDPVTVLTDPAPQDPVFIGLSRNKARIGDQISITGTGFDQVRSVLFESHSGDSLPARFFNLNGQTLQVQVPAGAKTARITLTDGDGNAIQTSTLTVVNRVWFVDSHDPGVPETGNSWSQAANFTFALQQAEAGDEIWFAAGTYYGAGTPIDPEPHVLKPDVPLYGGFKGGDPRNLAFELYRDERRPVPHQTIFTGDIDNDNGVVPSRDPADPTRKNDYPALMRIDLKGTYLIDGLIFENITRQLVGNAFVGWAFDNLEGTSLTIRNSIFRNNLSVSGALSHVSGQLTLENVLFDRNSAMLNGGGAYLEDRIIDTEDEIVIKNCIFTQNKALESGGGLSLYSTASDSHLITVENSLFIENEAMGSGGGIYADDPSTRAEFNLRQNVFYGNTVLTGGGAGLSNTYAAGFVTNNIFWKNLVNGNDREGYRMLFALMVAHNIVQPNDEFIGNNDNISQDPLLLIDQNTPAAGLDGVFWTLDDGLRVAAGSPAIDSGATDSAYTTLTDILGVVRASPPDRGAYEYTGY